VEITPHVEAIRADLAAVVEGDERSAAVAERLGRALDSSIQLRLLDALGQAALELSAQTPAGHVEVRLAGRDAQLVYVAEQESPEAPATPDDESVTARITLRMSDGLKMRVEAAADAEGLSANAWLVRAAQRALERRREAPRRTGNRITGYARS
jgi:predicted HicB family RNase H-like nuclease